MNLRQLRYFLSIAQLQSVTRAAEVLRIAADCAPVAGIGHFTDAGTASHA